MNPTVTIVTLGDRAEAVALRALLEAMEHECRLIRAKHPEDVAPALSRASQDDVVVLSAQGGPRGFWMGAFEDGVDVTMMDGAWMPADVAFKGVTFRDDTVLISTAAATRDNGLIGAMMTSGGRLIAPIGTPERRIVVPWIAACLLRSGTGLAEAVVAANGLVAQEDHFSYA